MIGNRLKMLREGKGKTMKQVAADLEMKETTYRNYEHEVSEPSITTLIKFSMYYNINVDWILGLEQKNSTPPESKWDALRSIMNELPEPAIDELLSYALYLEWKSQEQKKSQT